MKLLRIAAWTVGFLLSWITLAHAGPVAAAIGAVATAIGSLGVVGKLVLGIALQVGASLLQRAMQKEELPPGIRSNVAVGGVNSLSFIVGSYATAGSLEYVNTWGKSGDTPNAYVTQVLSLSDLPLNAILSRVWVNSEECTIDFGDVSYEMGFPVTEFETDGQYNHLWVKPNLGGQTVADPFLVDKFSGDADRPWQADMIGRGVAYVSVTTQFNREFFTGIPKTIIEVQGIPLYDPRKDTSVGGSGPQRFGQPETYAFTDNPVVIIYNIMRGIYYDGAWVYGPEVPALRLPLSNWFAAMNECDVAIPIGGGGTERQFRCGFEIHPADMEPVAVIDELLLACNGRMAEIGGIYKIHVGAPALPSYFFTDEDIVVTEGQTFEPFPGYEATYNGASASYPEPLMAWGMKDAPQYRNATFEGEDFGEIKLAGLTFNAVPFPLQVQRLMRSMTNDNRGFRRHQNTLPPETWLFEPLDTFSWTSARNGYVNKLFIVDGMDDLGNVNQAVALLETDPTDYDWSTDFELPWSVGSLTPQFPAPQVMSGWQVAPAILYDNDGTARRPTIEVFFDGDRDDVEYVRVQVRLQLTGAPAFDGRVTYDKRDTPGQNSTILDGAFLPNVAYEVRGDFVPFTGRKTVWSAWLPVTTPDVKLVPGKDFDPFEGVVGFDNLREDLAGYQDWLGGSVREVERRLEELNLWISDQDLGNETDRKDIERQLKVEMGRNTASFNEKITVLVNADIAIAQQITTLEAEVVDLDSGVSGNASAIQSLSTSVTNINGQITAISSDITSLESTVTNQAGEIAGNANAISSLSTQVTNLDGEVTAYADAITSLSAATNANNVNTANFRMSVVSGPSGYSRIGAEGRQGGAGAWRSAGWYLEVPNNTGLPTRFVVQADQFIVLAGSGLNNPFVIDGTAVRMNVANIGTVTAGLVRSANNLVRIELNNNRILIAD